jgi:hypothetical protein
MTTRENPMLDPVDCRICRLLLGFLTTPLILLISAGALIAA